MTHKEVWKYICLAVTGLALLVCAFGINIRGENQLVFGYRFAILQRESSWPLRFSLNNSIGFPRIVPRVLKGGLVDGANDDYWKKKSFVGLRMPLLFRVKLQSPRIAIRHIREVSLSHYPIIHDRIFYLRREALTERLGFQMRRIVRAFSYYFGFNLRLDSWSRPGISVINPYWDVGGSVCIVDKIVDRRGINGYPRPFGYLERIPSGISSRFGSIGGVNGRPSLLISVMGIHRRDDYEEYRTSGFNMGSPMRWLFCIVCFLFSTVCAIAFIAVFATFDYWHQGWTWGLARCIFLGILFWGAINLIHFGLSLIGA